MRSAKREELKKRLKRMILSFPGINPKAVLVPPSYREQSVSHLKSLQNAQITSQKPILLDLEVMGRYIEELFLMDNWLPSKDPSRDLSKAPPSSNLRLSFSRGFITRMLLALLGFVLKKTNRC
nr:hypothetical protein Iba_scaffold20277CG0050 [Ipomoea batatas]